MRVDPIIEASKQMVQEQNSNSYIKGVVVTLLVVVGVALVRRFVVLNPARVPKENGN